MEFAVYSIKFYYRAICFENQLISESQKENNDLVDLLTTSFQDVVITEVEPGRFEKALELKPRRAWWQLHSVASTTLGRFAFELESFERKAEQARYHMSRERAEDFAKNVHGIVSVYMSSVDAKSSESLSDKNNAIQTLIDKIKSNNVTRRYVMKDELKNAGFAGLFGKNQAKDTEND